VGGTRVTAGTVPAPRVDLRNKKVLVTGGAGFVGHNFIRVLRRDFNCHVVVIDNLWRGSLSNLDGLIDVSWLALTCVLTLHRCCARLADRSADDPTCRVTDRERLRQGRPH